MSLKKFENQLQFEEYKLSSEYKEPNISLIDNIIVYNSHTDKIFYIDGEVMESMTPTPMSYNSDVMIMKTVCPYSKDILDSDKIILSAGPEPIELVKVQDSVDSYGLRYCAYNTSNYNVLNAGAARDISMSSISLFIHGYEFYDSIPDEDLRITLVGCNISGQLA